MPIEACLVILRGKHSASFLRAHDDESKSSKVMNPGFT